MATKSKKSRASKSSKPVAKRVMRKYPADAKIRVLVKENPYREGGTRGKAFASIKSGMKIGAFVKGDKSRLRLVRRSTRAGYLAIIQ